MDKKRERKIVMVNSKMVMKSLPMIASILGRKYGVKVEIGGDQACTNGSTIVLPSLPMDADDVLINLARSYLDHESSHIRFTDFSVLEGCQMPLLKHIWNIFEDRMVENKLADIYPGCRDNFNWLNKHVFTKTRPKANNPATEIADYILLAVRSWDVAEVEVNRDNAAAIVIANYPSLYRKISAILDQVKVSCNSSQDCMAYAQKVVDIIQKEIGELEKMTQPKSMKQSNAIDSITDSQQDENAKRKTTRNQNESTSQNGTESNCNSELVADQADTESTKINQSDTQANQEKAKDLKALVNASENDLPDNIGESLRHELNVASDGKSGIKVAVESNKKTAPFKGDELTDIRRTSKALHSRLQGLLQSTELKRRLPARHGRLDTSRLYKIGYSSKLFLRHQERQGINTAVHILLDCSGSMHRRMELACKACYSIADSLNRIRGINLGITAFPARPLYDTAHPNGLEETIAPVLKHGQQLQTDFRMASGGSTPMAEALWWVIQQLYPLSENRKLILIITDGKPDHIGGTRQALNMATGLGYEVYGIGINNINITHLLPERSVVIKTMNELAPAMFKLLQCALLGQYVSPVKRIK
jgi:cobalamin biosynthesis protein CobT